ncbi:MFS transporter [Paraburkholderia fungorum]|jgi:FSR family fosmidomycin resistance protein-like MFS transporter|uniref:MFS transporter n=1 Tax=Paraburkholderia fungorum TaxID=134537 RepID=A0AAP5Q2Y5_9BURK|nr:MFS transporter [Paraburkholderia fungorum]MBB4515099.1 FSR family fosmidomycin resistance protein-like MFS transporter [Paraburkholderia fungorum]MBB6203042.1 FSR family fosmidomycin resistance protein-like MFS transporter [Paraburkholderia fungorum]MBU7442733.1 MFS transporter [Paraburkholderia fungorum]MDT8836198.1 MFS transporter [Paraburkholderia fungorum]PRZ56859.1 FSR family fosmidomycin resistance protein-like MFS transporter [Paraburkholderia fungorum]
METSLDKSALAGASASPASTAAPAAKVQRTVYSVLGAISFSHLLNDMIQSLILAIYPMLKDNFSLSFGQIGLITLTYQITASLLQPLVGSYTDKHPKPYSLPVGMGFTLAGLLLMSVAPSFGVLLVAAALVGCGSSVFHPESSRVARLASGGKHGLAQSLFQVGGNAGSSLGPLLAALIVIPHGQRSIAWFSVAALVAIVVLAQIGRWYKQHPAVKKTRSQAGHATLSRNQVMFAMAVLMLLVFSKYFYLASINSYFTFYLIDKFHLPVQAAQVHLFVFLAAVAAGTVIGGPIGDRIGRKYVIWVSILGVAPFTLLLPYANLFWTGVLTVIIGIVLASAFSAILVYAQELIPGKVGMVAGLFFGFAFGMGGVGAAVLGQLADATSITYVYKVCSFLPLIGVLTVFLPDVEGKRAKA